MSPSVHLAALRRLRGGVGQAEIEPFFPFPLLSSLAASGLETSQEQLEGNLIFIWPAVDLKQLGNHDLGLLHQGFYRLRFRAQSRNVVAVCRPYLGGPVPPCIDEEYFHRLVPISE